eukprot:7667482-Ditylum_brightwellii.AAC.1
MGVIRVTDNKNVSAKHGEVQDQGVDQPNNGLPRNASRVRVQSGTLHHHITRMDPMLPGDVNITLLNQMKFDVVNGFITTNYTSK